MAALVLAIGTSAIFSVSLSSRVQLKQTAVREQLHHEGRRLIDDLRAYVTADTATNANAPVRDTDGARSWNYPGDTNTLISALGIGDHDVTARLPDALKNAPSANPPGVGATMIYTVSADATGTTRIDVTMTWEVD